MKKKNILLLFVLVLLMVPSLTNALTEEESKQKAQEILDRIPVIENEDGTCTWEVKSIDIRILQENTCNDTKETIVEKYPNWANFSDEELEENLASHNNSCNSTVVTLLVDNFIQNSGLDKNKVYTDWMTITENQATILSNYEYEDEYGNINGSSLSKTCFIKYEEVDENKIEEAVKVTENFEYNYNIYGFNTLNSVYHYGAYHDNNNAFNDSLMLYRFPEFKEVIMNNPEYDYKIAWEGAGGMLNMNGSAGYVTLYKDGIVYAMRYVGFGLYGDFYVDKNAEGTPAEKAEDRIKEYFGENVFVEVDKENVTYYNEDGFNGYYTQVTIGEHTTDIFIIEVEEKDLDKYNVQAYHKETGVGVDSDSYEVPVDATLDVKDVKDEEYVKKAFSNGMFTLTDAYDISVIKTANGTIVDVIENGIEVYIPVEKRKVGQKVNIHHITEDGKLGDKYQAVVVEKDGKLYAHFTTTHFSTYAVSDIVATDVGNPETFDNITTSLLIGTIAVISLLTVSFIFVKKNEILK